MAGMTSLTPPSSKLNFLYDNVVKSQFSDQTVACACIYPSVSTSQYAEIFVLAKT